MATWRLVLAPQEWVILATDGFTNFAPHGRPSDTVVSVLRDASSPRQVAADLIAAAARGGAGDNVAVVVAAPVALVRCEGAEDKT